MALAKFNAPPLPMPGKEYSADQMRQLVRIIDIYHNQLDSMTPNIAESYTADFFFGAVVLTKLTTAQKLALPLVEGAVIYDSTLKKMCICNGTAWETVTSA